MGGSSKKHEEEWRELIFNAFNKCLEEDVPLSEITVKRICEEAHISKPTFYRYFDNKDDMCVWICKRIVDAGLCQVGRTCTWFVGLYRSCLMAKRYKAFFTKAATNEAICASMDSVVDHQREMFIETLDRYLHVKAETVTLFQIEAFLSSSRAMLRYWGETGMCMPPEEIAAYITSVVPWGLFNRMRDPAQGFSDSENRINMIAIDNIRGRTIDYHALGEGESVIEQVLKRYNPEYVDRRTADEAAAKATTQRKR